MTWKYRDLLDEIKSKQKVKFVRHTAASPVNISEKPNPYFVPIDSNNLVKLADNFINFLK